ncbi:MAG: alpha/beta fold hydrolase [Lewinella sp.]|nr:alpha/beta fold hydrolase [Lewinella sp.]
MAKARSGNPGDGSRRYFRTIRAVLNGTVRLSPVLAGQLTYQLLGAPRHKEPEPHELPFLTAARAGKIPLGKSEIQTYHWPGAGPRIVLAHGWDSHSGRWHALGERLLAAGYDLYALDAPAHGRSTGNFFSISRYARSLGALLKEVEPAAVIGHSAGGMAAIYYLTQYPKPVMPGGLVIMATPAELADFVRAFQQALELDERVIEGLDAVFRRRLDRPLHYFSISRFARALQIPGLILHDEADPVAPVAGARRIHRYWEQSELKIFTGLDHSLRDDAVWETTLDWLAANQL